jgi:hypothetical protein
LIDRVESERIAALTGLQPWIVIVDIGTLLAFEIQTRVDREILGESWEKSRFVRL